jgi:cytochrome b involved in lipid metabolism
MKLKILVVISLFIFWSLLTAIIVAGLLSKGAEKQTPGNKQLITIPDGQAQIVLSSLEVAKHNTSSDCWTIISGKVYNFTGYLRSHPGGVGTMTPYCGKDGTTAFANRGGTGSHSGFASSLLASYLVGTLNQSVGTTTIQNTQTITLPPAQRREDDD